MRTFLLVGILSSALVSMLMTLPVFGEDIPTTDGNSYFLCKSGKAVRTIRVENNASGCKATYTKEGIDSQAAKNTKGEKCQAVADRIRTNLEMGKWSCRDISSARLSYSQ